MSAVRQIQRQPSIGSTEMALPIPMRAMTEADDATLARPSARQRQRELVHIGREA